MKLDKAQISRIEEITDNLFDSLDALIWDEFVQTDSNHPKLPVDGTTELEYDEFINDAHSVINQRIRYHFSLTS
jgi:hypothetical protein